MAPIPKQCYLHPHVKKIWIADEIGYGLSATKLIKKGDITTIVSGMIITKSEIVNATREFEKLIDRWAFEIDEGLALVPDRFPILDVWYLNHSCDPNLGNFDKFTSFALQDIAPGEQLTIDYATLDSNEITEYQMNCLCDSSNCRKIITGDDWMIPELQEKYKGYFQPHIQRKIDLLKQIPE